MNNMLKSKITAVLCFTQCILLFSSLAVYAENKLMNHFDLGVIYLSDKKFEKALSSLANAIDENPDCSKCFFARGYALENLGRTAEALSDYDRALKLNPKDANIYFYRGMLRMAHQANRHQAISDFTKCLQMDPRNGQRYYRARGTAHSLNKHPQKALADYDKVMSQGVKDSALLYNIGGCYLDLDQYDKALVSLTEAVNIDSDNDLALLNIAKIYAHQNKKNKSLRYLKLAVQKNGHVSKYGVAKDDHRWDNIRDTKEFKKLKTAGSTQ